MPGAGLRRQGGVSVWFVVVEGKGDGVGHSTSHILCARLGEAIGVSWLVAVEGEGGGGS